MSPDPSSPYATISDAEDDGAAPAPAPAPASTGARVAAGVAGAVLVLIACVVTGGLALASFAAMGVVALVARRRQRPYTTVAGWGGAVFAAVLAFAAIAAFGVGAVPRSTFDRIRQQTAIAAQHRPPPDAVQRTIDKVYPGTTAIGQAQSEAMTRSMASSPALFWALMAFGALFAAGFFGAFVGSAAWGSATVLLFAVLGHWPGRGRQFRRV